MNGRGHAYGQGGGPGPGSGRGHHGGGGNVTIINQYTVQVGLNLALYSPGAVQTLVQGAVSSAMLA